MNLQRSDTGLWHLTVYISETGIRSWLHLKEEPGAQPRLLVTESWPAGSEGVMQKISDVVYDHPEILDDYSASIIIESPYMLAAPAELIKDDADSERIFCKVFNCEPEDIMTDQSDGNERIIFTLTRGISGFLQRTFPGARIYSHAAILKRVLRHTGTGVRIFVDARAGEADILVFNGDRLLSIAVQPWSQWSDLAYRIYNAATVYELNLSTTEVWLSGDAEVTEKLSEFLTSRVGSVRLTDRGVASPEMPTAALFSISK